MKDVSYVLGMKSENTLACVGVDHVDLIALLPCVIKSAYRVKGLVGLINYRRESIPLYDLSELLNNERKHSYTINNMVVILSCGGKKIAILIDDVVDIFEITGIEELKDKLQRKLPIVKTELVINDSIYFMLDETELLSYEA